MPPPSVREIPIDDVPAGETRRYWLELTRDEIGEWHRAPVIVRRGADPGPVVGLTAALHGNELNGMRAIHALLGGPQLATLQRGAIIAVPVVNLPGYRRHERAFADGKDLNRYVSSEQSGRPAARYARAFAAAMMDRCDYLVDLHTAGGGRRNVFYARVDLENKAAKRLAKLIAPPIIAHKPPRKNALRGYAAHRGIPAVVLEIGDPGRFQPGLVAKACAGIQRLLADLGMIADAPEREAAPIMCRDSYWIRAKQGGAAVLSVKLGERVAADQAIGDVYDLWGDVREEICVSRAGVVIGMLRRPMVMSGSPIVHIGVERDKTSGQA